MLRKTSLDPTHVGGDLTKRREVGHARLQLYYYKLRMVEGVENTLSCVVYETVKETTDVLA